MESAGLRRRERENTQSSNMAATPMTDGTDTSVEDPPVPRYTIDQSLPPMERYKHVAEDFKSYAQEMPSLFDEVVQECTPNISVSKVKKLARLALGKVQNKEENEELRGIAEVIGIDMWLLVAHNVLLDMFMGCTSGGVRVNHTGVRSRMLHFRTLDWGMDLLRKIIVHLDFIERPGGEVIASSLTYFGFVGVLTGVRKGLSMSLNFRPTHNSGTLANVRFYSHMLLVLLGYRPSISSVLRHLLLPANTPPSSPKFQTQSLEDIERTLPSTTTTAAYLIMCDGERTITMEKDNHTANTRSSQDFIVATNHDLVQEELQNSRQNVEPEPSKIVETAGMKEIVEESVSRKCAMVDNWERSLRSSESCSSQSGHTKRQALTQKQITKWLNGYPITNEMTHFATLMDPKAGKVVWLKRYLRPLESESDSQP